MRALNNTSMPNITYMDEYINDGHKSVLSLNNFYETILVGNDKKPNHIYQTPLNDFFIKYRRELEEIIDLYTVPERMFYQPKTLSYELYGTTELWLSILRVNGMRNVTEFHEPIIKIYNAGSLFELINIFFKRDKIIT